MIEILASNYKIFILGYERILQYKHTDGSFSAFGEKYGQGSIFLTAFVIRTLAQSSKYVFIDKNVIKHAISWILERQLENGCFVSNSHVFHSGLSVRSKIKFLTFVLN